MLISNHSSEWQATEIRINSFRLVKSFGGKDHIKEMKLANAVLLSLFMTSYECATTATPLAPA